MRTPQASATALATAADVVSRDKFCREELRAVGALGSFFVADFLTFDFAILLQILMQLTDET